MREANAITGTYGSLLTPCRVFTMGGWYAVEGSRNINYTPRADLLIDGVNVELLPDVDHFTADEEVDSERDLVAEVADYEA